MFLFVLFAVLLASIVVAKDGDVPDWERQGLEFVNGWPGWLEPIMWAIQQPGVLLFPYVVGAVVALVTRRWHYAIPFVLLPMYKLTIEKGVVKSFVDRRRPFTSIGPEINARGDADLGGLSFPSGHTTTAVATALLLAVFLPKRWAQFVIAWGLMVGVARLYLGEHNVLDVVAGACVASIFVVVMRMLFINRWVGDGPVTNAS